VERLGHPLLSTTLPGEMVEDYTDPELMYENFDKLVDVVVDGGMGGMEVSTMVDLTGEEPELIRQGKGAWLI
jgi:tRNA A37 threonylcarbamoyladenosine synthetase subunit TsaC/SUA5/YrdC